MTIKPIDRLTPAEIRDLAHAAADNGQSAAEANPFDPTTQRPQCELFDAEYLSRHRELALV